MSLNGDHGRPEWKDNIEVWNREETAPMLWNPETTSFETFGSIAAKFATIGENLNYEKKRKYTDKYMAQFKAKVEIRTLPECYAD